MISGYNFVRTLDKKDSLPAGLIRVPATETEVGSLVDFFIGRFEVTNREYKEFVDADGYGNREFWKHPFMKDGRKLTWEEGMVAPVRPKWNGSSRPHDGSIRTTHPNRMWGTDAKQFWTRRDGQCWFFGLIDHWNDEILGWHASHIGNRFAALEPVHQAVKTQFGSLDKGVALETGLFLRGDHGSQYDSDDFQNELKFLGLAYSPAFVRSPQCNGIIERFNRTLQEQVFDLHCFETIDEARIVIAKFIDDYNRFWLIERLGHRSPLEFKADQQNIFLKCA